MADFAYNIAKFQLLNADLDFNAPDDIRVLLLQAATDEDADDSSITAILARAGTTQLTTTGYTRADGTLAGEATTIDLANDRGEFDATDAVFSTVGPQDGTETVVAFVVYKYVGLDSLNIPIAFVDAATNLPLTPNGSDITIQWNAEGILQTT
jgi:hypothetical protein